MNLTTVIRVCCLLLGMLPLHLETFAQSEAENEAYRTFYGEKDVSIKVALGEKFMTDFKESNYRSPILQTIMSLYVQNQNWPKVLAHADMLDVELPDADTKAKTAIFSYAMAAAQATNNSKKTIEYGEQLLGLDPANLQAQILVSTTIPIATPQDKALELANKARIGRQTARHSG